MSSSEPVPAPARFAVDLGVDRDVTTRSRGPAGSRRGPLIRRALVVADVGGLTIALLAGAVAERGVHAGVAFSDLLVYLGVLAAWAVAARLYGLYGRDERRPDHSTLDDIAPLFNILTAGTWLGVLAVGLSRVDGWSLRSGLAFWLTALVVMPPARAVARALARRHADFVQNAVIVGAGDVGQLVGRKLQQHPEFGIKLVGFVDSEPKDLRDDLDHIPLLGRIDEIVDVVRRNDVQRVVVAFSNDSHDTLLDLVHSLRDLDIEIDVVPRLFEAVGPAVGIHAVEGLALVGLPSIRPSRTARAVKRLLDVVGASIILVVTSPLLAWIAWRIKRDSPGPIMFRQERLGERMKPFTLLKFRTMTEDADDAPHRNYVAGIMDLTATPTDGNLFKLERPDEVTKVGAWLRRTSLDELPQLLNVLRGEMSLVGPRPCLAYETELFEQHHFDRFLVPAGMTGLWQVEARARSTFKEALDLDAAYARNWSPLLDLWLLARTPLEVFRSREATQ
jgi:exopolysaccharide biosynthesis polyprenyl glycosylphosphotransferase